MILNQFQRERSLLITSELRNENRISNELLINYYLNDSQNDLNTLNFSYLQNKSIAFPSSNFIRINPTGPKRDHSLLVLSISNKLSFEQFDQLILKFPNVNSITFNSRKNCQLITPYGLNLIFNKCTSLTTIVLTDCKELNSDCLKVIANHCQTLEHLDLTNSRHYGNNGLKNVLRQCTKLKGKFRLLFSIDNKVSSKLNFNFNFN